MTQDPNGPALPCGDAASRVERAARRGPSFLARVARALFVFLVDSAFLAYLFVMGSYVVTRIASGTGIYVSIPGGFVVVLAPLAAILWNTLGTTLGRKALQFLSGKSSAPLTATAAGAGRLRRAEGKWYRSLWGWSLIVGLVVTIAAATVITSVDFSRLVQSFPDAAKILRRIARPDASILGEVVQLTIITVFMGLMSTLLAIPAAVVLSFFGARNLMRGAVVVPLGVAVSFSWGLIPGFLAAGYPMSRLGDIMNRAIGPAAPALPLLAAVLTVMAWCLALRRRSEYHGFFRAATRTLVLVLAALAFATLRASIGAALGLVLSGGLASAGLAIPIARAASALLPSRSLALRRLGLGLLGVVPGVIVGVIAGAAISLVAAVLTSGGSSIRAFSLVWPILLGAIGAWGGFLFLRKREWDSPLPLGMLLYTGIRASMSIVRSIEPIIWAIIFVIWVRPGPFPGMLALFVCSIADLTKLYSEQLESIDIGPTEAITAVGGRRLQVLLYGIVPQIINPYLSFTLYRCDINVRMGTVIGMVGGGGIGMLLMQYVRVNEWEEVSMCLIAITLVVWAIDTLSARLRARLA